jgi:hypothetical protein
MICEIAECVEITKTITWLFTRFHFDFRQLQRNWNFYVICSRCGIFTAASELLFCKRDTEHPAGEV